MLVPNSSASFQPILFNAIPTTLPWDGVPSRFWAELKKDESPGGEKLRVVVRAVVEGAAALSGQVVRDMPFYTDHGPRHLRNVLHVMERLVTEEGIQELQPIGCALCIVAAYIHDLGMVLSAEERTELERIRRGQEPGTDFGRKYRSHEDSHAELIRERNRLLKAGDASDAKCIADHLLAEFLRRRHAEESPETGAIARELKKLLGYSELMHADLDWFPSAVAIAASHGKAPGWLREKHCEGNAERIRVHLDGARTTNLGCLVCCSGWPTSSILTGRARRRYFSTISAWVSSATTGRAPRTDAPLRGTSGENISR